MSYQKIYDAATKQDTRELHQAIDLDCIDKSKQGTYYFSAVSQLAKENNIIAVEFLIKHGANINYAAQGAASGGHKDFSEALISRGANINWAAQGAASGGHKDFAEALISRGANINDGAVYGAAIGGHKDLAGSVNITWR